MNRILWVAQYFLAALFLFAGISKLVMPLQQMVDQTGLPGGLLIFVGCMETLGGLGLILPGIFRLWTWLIPLAAAGLVIIMIGATTLTLRAGMIAIALFPFMTGLIALFVLWGRWRVAPLSTSAKQVMTRTSVAS